MMHARIKANVFTTRQPLSVVDTATEVKIDVAETPGESTLTMEQSLQLLRKIAFSLRVAG